MSPDTPNDDDDGEEKCTQEHKDHALDLVRMADMVTRSSEKTSKKAELQQFDESGALDFMEEDSSPALTGGGGGGQASSSGQLLPLDAAADEKAGKSDAEEGDGAGGGSGGGGGGGSGGSASVGGGLAAPGESSPPSTGGGGRRSSGGSKKDKTTTTATTATATSTKLSYSDATKSSPTPSDPPDVSTASSSSASATSAAGGGAPVESDASLRDQLTQTRRALLQVRENAKLKHRKLELEHASSKKEIKKAKDVIEKQTVEYKKLKVKLDGVARERDDAKEELARELGGRGSLVSGISQENGRMIRRLREIRSERDNMQKERDDLVRQLELCRCDAGKGFEATFTSSLAHETAPVTSAALSQRSFGLDEEFANVTASSLARRSAAGGGGGGGGNGGGGLVTESRRNIFESARSIRSNLSDEMESEVAASRAEAAKRSAARRRGSNGSTSHVSFKRQEGGGGGGGGGLLSGMVIGFGGRGGASSRRGSGESEEKDQHDLHDDHGDGGGGGGGGDTASFISMSVRSLPAAVVSSTRHAVKAFSSTSMRSLMEEVDPDHERPDVDFPSGGRRRRTATRRGRRSYETAEDGDGDRQQANLAPRAEDSPQSQPDGGGSFWAATSQRFLMGMSDEVSTS